MTAKTHYAFSYLIASSLGLPREIALLTSIVALLPDIDHTSSILGRLFPGISKAIMSRHGHRTITHSMPSFLVLIVLLSPLIYFYPIVYKGVVAAYFSHLFIDCFNMSGVRLFYPFSQKEYISFKTETLRIKVSSWQEIAVFVVILFSIVLMSGRSVSLTQTAFSLSRVFFKSYSIAYKSYRDLSNNYCTAKITYFNSLMRKKEEITAPVLAMSADKIILKHNNDRLVIAASDIIKIKVDSNKIPISMKHFDNINDIPYSDTVYISGTILYQNYIPNIKSNDFIATGTMPTSLKVTITAITPEECSDLLGIIYEVEEEKEKLKKKLPAYRLAQLQNQERLLERRINRLSNEGLYKNYNTIEKLTSKIRSVQNKQETLLLQREEGGNDAVQAKLNQLEGFSLVTDLYWWEME